MSRIEELEKRLASDPNSRIFVQLAEEYRKQGLLEQAIDVCEEGLKKHPEYPSARVALGRALLEDESFDRASAEFEAVLAQLPDNILANKFLGETYHRLGRFDDALAKYEVAKTLAPEDGEIDDKMAAVEADRSKPQAAATAPADASEVETREPEAQAPSEPRDSFEDATAILPPPERAPDAEPAGGEPEPELASSSDDVDSASPPPVPEPPRASADDELPPIPLSQVDGPMELEDPHRQPASPPRTADPTERDEVEAEPTPVSEASEGPWSVPESTPVLEAESAPKRAPEPDSGPEPEAVFEIEAEREPEPIFEAQPEDSREPQTTAPGAFVEAEALPTPVIEATAEGGEPGGAGIESLAPSGREPRVVPPAAAGEIETPTMAEIFASQGHYDRAITVYRSLLEREPTQSRFLDRIGELEAAAASAGAGAPPSPSGMTEEQRQRTVEVLEEWLHSIRRSKGT